ncbi:hypothetical protein KXQ82_00155 [Mucilaginibacter sp. HMF5004]|uniref:hypothetical protein n=1 Tax=Mucilaginibacter rivuli TaxID=2857527 RepID=UPI001C5D56E0|nr:hypothetical protein [Mucilaginibacter rivuli]MBW4888097.1 hypothetical protein [Mucilaginibacter rivuli]
MAINNINDLRAEIALLKVQKTEQEAAIKKHFSSPSAIFSTIFSGFSSNPAKDNLFNVEDLVALASRLFLPFALNKTLFRNSNFLVKMLVNLVSQKASGIINHETVSTVWDKIRSFIPLGKKDKKKPVDYGIPPLSESY